MVLIAPGGERLEDGRLLTEDVVLAAVLGAMREVALSNRILDRIAVLVNGLELD